MDMVLSFTKEGRKEMFYLIIHSTHFIYDYMASDCLLSLYMYSLNEKCHSYMSFLIVDHVT